MSGPEFPVKLVEWPDTSRLNRCDAFENGNAIGIPINQHLDVVSDRCKAGCGSAASQIGIVAEFNLHAAIVPVTRSIFQTVVVATRTLKPLPR
jgi:hypothetical protein